MKALSPEELRQTTARLREKLSQGATLEDLRIDGMWIDRGPRVRLAVSRSMFGGEEWEFHRPVLVGDTITAQSVIP